MDKTARMNLLGISEDDYSDRIYKSAANKLAKENLSSTRRGARKGALYGAGAGAGVSALGTTLLRPIPRGLFFKSHSVGGAKGKALRALGIAGFGLGQMGILGGLGAGLGAVIGALIGSKRK